MSGIRNLVQQSTKGRSVPTNAELKAIRTGTKGSAPRPANLPKKGK